MTHRVVVTQKPLSLVGQARGVVGGFPTETIPNIRVTAMPSVIHDSMVMGFTSFSGSGIARMFTYNVVRREVSSVPVPAWLSEVAMLSAPALSPDGRHVAYLAATPQQDLYIVARTWPNGVIVARGPTSPPPNEIWPVQITWQDSNRFVTYYRTRAPIAADEPTHLIPVHFNVRGSVQAKTVAVDTFPDNPTVAQAPATAPPAPEGSSPPVAPAGQPTEDVWARAAREITRLPPAAFPQIPPAFARELDSLHCAIPQSAYSGGPPHNVVRGHFGAKGQDDWAALCSRGGRSVILVHWSGPLQCPRELAEGDDANMLQGLGGGRIGYSRGLRTVNLVPEYPDESDTTRRDTTIDLTIHLEHDGIDDAFEGKASVIWFCRNGKWIRYAGAD